MPALHSSCSEVDTPRPFRYCVPFPCVLPVTWHSPGQASSYPLAACWLVGIVSYLFGVPLIRPVKYCRTRTRHSTESEPHQNGRSSAATAALRSRISQGTLRLGLHVFEFGPIDRGCWAHEGVSLHFCIPLAKSTKKRELKAFPYLFLVAFLWLVFHGPSESHSHRPSRSHDHCYLPATEPLRHCHSLQQDCRTYCTHHIYNTQSKLE